MYLIVGLGNPGNEYLNTRHNVGFKFMDYYANKYGKSFIKLKNNGLYIELYINNEKIILLKPQSYMNLSGDVVRKYVDYYKIPLEKILIIYDDLDLNLCDFKIKPSGSSAGHNGLKNIESNLSTKDYKRLKIGISNNKNMDTKDYVLSKFSLEEQKKIEDLMIKFSSLIEDFVSYPFDYVMNKYNKIRENKNVNQ